MLAVKPKKQQLWGLYPQILTSEIHYNNLNLSLQILDPCMHEITVWFQVKNLQKINFYSQVIRKTKMLKYCQINRKNLYQNAYFKGQNSSVMILFLQIIWKSYPCVGGEFVALYKLKYVYVEGSWYALKMGLNFSSCTYVAMYLHI